MMGEPGFREINHHGKPVQRDGFTAKSFKAVPIAVEHHSDGAVTVCREIADQIHNDKRVPDEIRKHFKPQRSIFELLNDGMLEFQLRLGQVYKKAKEKR